MPHPIDANMSPDNGLDQLVRLLREQVGDDGARELLAGAVAAFRARAKALLPESEEIVRLRAELEQTRRTVEEQKQLIERLQKENANLTAERDQYLRSLYFYVRKEMTVSEEEIAFLEQLDPTKENGVSFAEIMKMIESVKGPEHV